MLPVLLVFGLSVAVVLGWLLEALGFLPFNPILDNPLTNSIGFIGQVLKAVLLIEGAIIVVALLVAIPAAIPLIFILRDLLRTLNRYHVFKPTTPAQEEDFPYVEAAKKVFEQDPSVVVFVYGHTHVASLKKIDGRVVLNTGTWLKLPKKVPVMFGILPPVYRPTFRLNYFKIYEEDGKPTIHYEHVLKKPRPELTGTQRLLTLTRKADAGPPIPEKTAVDV